jgi:hypothetical protein
MTPADTRRLGILPPGQAYTTDPAVGHFSRCPHCVVEEPEPGTGHATRYFNGAGQLWAICERNGVRWYITRETKCPGIPDVPDEPGSLFDLPVVEDDVIWRLNNGRGSH